MTAFRTFRSNVNPFLPRDIHRGTKLLCDTNGYPVGIQNPSGWADGLWVPIDLTAAEIATPSALMIADLNSVFRLNVPPYTRYISNGTSLTTLAGGAQGPAGMPGPAGPVGPVGPAGPMPEGGPFLPLTGGTVTGPTSFSAGISSLPNGGSWQINVSGNDQPAFNWAYGNTRWYGKITGPDGNADSSIAANKFLWDDNADISGGNGTAAALYAQTNVQGTISATNTSSRQAMHAHLAVHGQVGAAPGPGIDFVAQLSTGYAVVPQGGTGGWTAGNNPDGGYFRGALFGGNDNVWLDTGASNFWMLVGREIDVFMKGSANVYQRVGLFEVSAGQQAQGDDAGILFGSGNPGHKVAIQFGSTTGDLSVSDALIKVVPRLYPSPATPAYVNGIDLSGATFSGNALATPGFAVNGTGHITSGGHVFTIIGAADHFDHSKHIDLNNNLFGFNVTSDGNLNYNANGKHMYYLYGAVVASMTIAGLEVGNNTVASGPILGINAAASTGKILRYLSAGLARWDVAVGGPEGTGNAGSDLVINRYGDAGGYLSTPLVLTRSTGSWAFQGAMGFQGTAPIAKPTGVAVTAAAIHAALVSYGLIAP